MKGAWPVVALGIALMAGCMDDPGPEENDSTDENETLVDSRTGEERVVRRVPVIHASGSVTLEEHEFTGQFQVHQNGSPTGEIQQMLGLDPGNRHRYDLDDLVPVGLPVRLGLEGTADLEHGDLDIWFDMPGEEIWAGHNEDISGGGERVELTVVRSGEGPIEAVVQYDDAEPVDEFDYRLHLTIDSNPFQLVGGVPVTVPVPPEALGLEVRFLEESPDRVWLWDDADELSGASSPSGGTWNETLTRSGDHVLLIPEGPYVADVTLLVSDGGDEDEDRMEPLPFGFLVQEFMQTDTQPFEDGSGSMTFEVDRWPIQFAVQAEVDHLVEDPRLRLEGPEGVLVDMSIDNDLPFVATTPDEPLRFLAVGEMGDPRLSTGSYTATIESSSGGAGELFAWTVFYGRT